MPTSETQPQPPAVAGVSMCDLLAACVAAEAISTPPRAPEGPSEARPTGRVLPSATHREAA